MPARKYDAKIKYIGETGCAIDFTNTGYVQRDLRDAYADGSNITISIQSRRKVRSLKQNDFYWGYFLQFEIDCFLEYWGELYDKKQVHDWNKQNFLGDVRAIESTGEIVRMPGSSKELSTAEFEVKLDDIRQWFSLNFEWEIPMPNDHLLLDV